jgi:hypothetical protein
MNKFLFEIGVLRADKVSFTDLSKCKTYGERWTLFYSEIVTADRRAAAKHRKEALLFNTDVIDLIYKKSQTGKLPEGFTDRVKQIVITNPNKGALILVGA